jgi:hypothetical protein
LTIAFDPVQFPVEGKKVPFAILAACYHGSELAGHERMGGGAAVESRRTHRRHSGHRTDRARDE